MKELRVVGVVIFSLWFGELAIRDAMTNKLTSLWTIGALILVTLALIVFMTVACMIGFAVDLNVEDQK